MPVLVNLCRNIVSTAAFFRPDKAGTYDLEPPDLTPAVDASNARMYYWQVLCGRCAKFNNKQESSGQMLRQPRQRVERRQAEDRSFPSGNRLLGSTTRTEAASMSCYQQHKLPLPSLLVARSSGLMEGVSTLRDLVLQRQPRRTSPPRHSALNGLAIRVGFTLRNLFFEPAHADTAPHPHPLPSPPQFRRERSKCETISTFSFYRSHHSMAAPRFGCLFNI